METSSNKPGFLSPQKEFKAYIDKINPTPVKDEGFETKSASTPIETLSDLPSNTIIKLCVDKIDNDIHKRKQELLAISGGTNRKSKIPRFGVRFFSFFFIFSHNFLSVANPYF